MCFEGSFFLCAMIFVLVIFFLIGDVVYLLVLLLDLHGIDDNDGPKAVVSAVNVEKSLLQQLINFVGQLDFGQFGQTPL